VPSCLKSRVSSQENCSRLGPAAVSVSELPTLSMRLLATRQGSYPRSALSMSGTST
jgi:hypothetical protein